MKDVEDIVFTVCMEFDNNYDEVYFRLAEDYQIFETEESIDIIRKASVITIINLCGKVSIKYRKKIDQHVFFLQGSGWLLMPTVNYKIVDFCVDSNCSILLGNANKLYGFYDLNRISLFFPDDNSWLIHKEINKILINTKLLGNEYLSEVTRFVEYYRNLMKEEPYFEVAVCDEIPARCISMRGLILCKKKMLNKGRVFLFQYLFHEIIHQVIGNELVFEGKGRLWLKESLTEYLQTLYLSVRFGEELYFKRISAYLDDYNKNKQYEIPMMQIGEECSEKLFHATFASKGILLFHKLLYGRGIAGLSDIISELKTLGRRIMVEDFLECVDDNLYPNKLQIIYYLNYIGLPNIGEWKKV